MKRLAIVNFCLPLEQGQRPGPRRLTLTFETQRQNTQLGGLTEIVLIYIEANKFSVLFLAHGMDLLGSHVAEVAVLRVHEARPGRRVRFAEGAGVVRRKVVDHHLVAPLLLESKFGLRGRALWLSAFARRCWLRALQYAGLVSGLFPCLFFVVDDGTWVIILVWTFRYFVNKWSFQNDTEKFRR